MQGAAIPDADNFAGLAGAARRLFRVPFDPRLLARKFPPLQSQTTVVQVLLAKGFKVALGAPPAPALAKLSGLAYFAMAAAVAPDSAPTLSSSCHGERITYLDASADHR